MSNSSVRITIGELMSEYKRYMTVYHSRKTLFSDAVNIENERTYLAQLNVTFQRWVSSGDYPAKDEISIGIANYREHLTNLKSLLIVELLKTNDSGAIQALLSIP